MTEHKPPENNRGESGHDNVLPFGGDIKQALGDAAVRAEPSPGLRNRVREAIEADTTPVDVTDFVRALRGTARSPRKVPGASLRPVVNPGVGSRISRELEPEPEYQDSDDENAGQSAQIIPMPPRKRRPQ